LLLFFLKIKIQKGETIMTTETMTIHRALSELKVLDSRVYNAINSGTYCNVNKHSNTKINGVPINEYEGEIKARYDKASDLIRRRNAIKRAVVLSNAVTRVAVGGIEYTVAEAIEMKNHGIELKEGFYSKLESDYRSAQKVLLDKNGDDLDKRAEQYVIGLYGSKEGKTNTDDFDKAKKDFITSNKYDLIDPIGVVKVMQTLEEEISVFKAEIDAVLSESNAITQIVVEY
jgi:hypothetical protein